MAMAAVVPVLASAQLAVMAVMVLRAMASVPNLMRNLREATLPDTQAYLVKLANQLLQLWVHSISRAQSHNRFPEVPLAAVALLVVMANVSIPEVSLNLRE